MPSRRSSVAVVGGGITGACAASELAKHFENVVVFDQGRRGPGGRASHRSVDKNDKSVLPDDEIPDYSVQETLQFDHGCQFFRADSNQMKNGLLSEWLANGWATAWKGRIGSLGSTETPEYIDFFGLPSNKDKVYIGVGGMHQLPRKILSAGPMIVHRGTRVSRVEENGEGRWNLYGVSGNAAFHDTQESEAKKQSEDLIFTADAVIFTDISSSADSWHRASAGIPDLLLKQIPDKVRLPLFSCMVALDRPIANVVPFDGFTVPGSTDLWFASRSQSKPGIPDVGPECWTLVSTPSFAVSEIKTTTMRDPITGAFRPQENDYINTVPGPALFEAFLGAVKSYIGDAEMPKAAYLQAQRWGSGLPAPESIASDIEEIVGTRYAATLKSSLVYPSDSRSTKRDFVSDDKLRLYYAGDFCSHRNPGFEAAALSGLDVAKHIIASPLA